MQTSFRYFRFPRFLFALFIAFLIPRSIFAQSPQTITFTTNAPANAAYGSSFTVAATASSGLPVVFTSSGACGNVGATYSMISSTGACIVIADQPGDGQNFLAAPTATQSTNASLAGSSASLTSLANIIFPNQSTTLTATVSSTGSGGAPSGTVTLRLGANTLRTGTLAPIDPNDSTASITLLASQLTPGANSLTAVYSGDQNYTGTTSPNISVTLQNPPGSFPPTAVGTAATPQLLTFQFSNPVTLSAVNILTSGASGLDYTDGGGSTCVANTAYAAGSSCTVNVAFTPTAPGMRAGAVTIFAQNITLPLQTSYLSGIGQSASVSIDPGTQTTIGTLSGGAPFGSAVDGSGNVYVADHAGNQVLEFKPSAGVFTQSTVLTGLNGPTFVALDGAGNLFVSDTQNNRVLFVPNENGALNGADVSIMSIAGLGTPQGIAVDGFGNLYVADSANGVVIELPSGGGTPVTIAQGLTAPQGVAVDASENVYVTTNNAVTEYPFGGGTPISLGSGFTNPSGLAVDAAGNIYVADTGNARIVEVPAGGGSQFNFAIASLTAPQDVSLDSADNLYVTDGSNVFEVNRTQAAPLSFPATSVGSTSPTQTVTLSNNGNQTLAISNIAISANFLQEPSGGVDCSSSTNLPPGNQCSAAVAFAPTIGGALAGTLTFTDNALNNTSSTQSVQLSGGAVQVPQTITFTTNAPVSAGKTSSFTVAAAASSGLTVVFTSAGVCTNVGVTYTMTSSTGTCTVIANQPGNDEFLPAPQVTQSTAAANLLTQTIAFATKAPTNAAFNSSFTVAATATSGLPVVFTSSGACTNSGATFTMTAGTGSCSVIANQPGNFDYKAAPTMTEATPAIRAVPTIAFTGAPATAPFKSAFTITATTNATTTPVIAASGPCSASGTTVTMTSGTGTCTIKANWAADGQYAAASAAQSTTAQKLTTTLTWATPNAISYGIKLGTSQLNATATSGNVSVPGTFVYTPSAGNLPIVGTATLSVAFTPANTMNYTAASTSVTLTVNQEATTSKITSAAPSAPTIGQSVQVNFNVTANFGKPTQTVTVSSSTGETCSATLTSGAGNCSLIFSAFGPRTMTATYSGDGNDLPSTSAPFSITAAPSTADFTLSMSPSSVSVNPGTTSPSMTLSVTTLKGFKGTVALTVNGLPAGVTFSSATPLSLQAGGLQSDYFFTLNASSATSPGAYPITLQGTSGSLIHSVGLTLNVAASADFTLLTSPSGLSVSPGGSSSPLTLSVSSVNGFSTAVNVSVAGLPAGVTISPSDPFPVNAGGNQQATISVPGTVANGNYPIVLTGTSGTLTHTANLMLTVAPVAFSQRFQHVVVIFQENRTPDNLFHGLPGADIADSGINSSGFTIPLAPIALANAYDLDHSHPSFVAMYDGGKMDGADKIKITCNQGAINCPPANPQFMYVDPDDVQPYFNLAETYAFGDRMFQTNQGPSLPAHQVIIAGTSAPAATSNLLASENPSTNGSQGCNSPPSASVTLIDPLGKETQTTFPCFEHETLMDELDAQNISWRYYTYGAGSIWTAPNAIGHLRFGTDWANVIIPQTKVLTDIASGKLAQMTWVIPDSADSDHPHGNQGTGPSWVSSVVNAIGKSQYWGNTAIIITWDDWGGWYDHVAPLIYNSNEYGFRVPLIVVSPYSRQGYVSHVTHDFGSILKFTEEVFNLPSLGYADSLADDLSDCFDLTQTPITFQVVPAEKSAEFFMNPTRPPTPPEDDE